MADLLGRLPKRSFVWRTAERPGPAVLRTRQVLSFLRGPLTRREIERLGQTWEGAEAVFDGLLAEPPPLPPDVPVRWLSAEGAVAMGHGPGEVWEATVYARFRVALRSHDGQEERLVHRWLRAEQAQPIELFDAWLERREPSADLRYGPVDPALWAPRTRRAWEDEIRASEHRVDDEGRVIRPERGDLALVGWAIVWIPRRVLDA